MIKTSELTRYFGTHAAVDGLSLHVKRGELFGFLGPNGAGKTTTIRMLMGLLRPSSGTALLGGHDVETEPMEVKRAVGYLAQTPLLYEKLTGTEFFRFIGGVHGLSDEMVDRRAQRLLDMVELSDKADDLIESYSGGMKQKIGLCAAMIHEPKLLILDEPLAGLDPYSARRIKDLLLDLCQDGGTVFLSTHILEIAERLCDRIGILDKGKLIAVGSMEELHQLAHSAEKDSGQQSTLEDLFLHLTGGEAVAEMATMLDG